MNPVRKLNVGLFGDTHQAGLREVLAHYGTGCAECWQAVVSQAVTPEELRMPGVHPVIGALCRVALPPSQAPTVRLGRAQRSVQVSEGGFNVLRIQGDALVRLVLEELLYRAEGECSEFEQWFGELEAALQHSRQSEQVEFLLDECRLVMMIRRYMRAAAQRLLPPWGHAAKTAKFVDRAATKLWKRGQRLGAQEQGYFQWLLTRANLRLEGSGGTLLTRQIDATFEQMEPLREPGASVAGFVPAHYEMVLDAERERQRRGETLRHIVPDLWLFLGVLEQSVGIDEDYPCIRARAARNASAVALWRANQVVPYAGLYSRLAMACDSFHPDMCTELVPRRSGFGRRAPEWLTTLTWGDVETAAEHLAANLAACWLVLHPEKSVHRQRLPLVALTDSQPWQVFRRLVLQLGAYPFVATVHEAGKRVVNLFAAQGGSDLEGIG